MCVLWQKQKPRKTKSLFRQFSYSDEKNFLPVVLLKKFLSCCISKCNLHFLSMLSCWVFTTRNITKMSHTQREITEIQFSKLNFSKTTFFTWVNRSFLVRIVLISVPGSKKHYSPQQLQDLSLKTFILSFLASFCPICKMSSFLSSYHLDLPLPIVL